MATTTKKTTAKRSTAKRSTAKSSPKRSTTKSTSKRSTAKRSTAARKPLAAGKLSAIDAAIVTLDKSGKPMHVPEIIEKAVPLTSLSGQTPGQTIYSVLYAEAKKESARVKRQGRGTFVLTANGKKAAKEIAAA